VFKVISTAGDTFLGGEDFDTRIMDWLVQGFLDEHDVDLRKDRMALQRLKDAAEKAKIELSSQTEAEINLPFIISVGQNEALHLQRTLRRNVLEDLCEDLISRTIDICQATINEADLDATEVEDVILVGGMTRMPMVQKRVGEFFKREPCKGVHPDEVVALGAAIQATALTDEANDMLLLDVTPHTLGIMIAGGHFEGLIPQNSTVPTSRSKIFTTIRDDQTAVKILVFQGEHDRAERNEALGEFVLTGLRKAPKGQVEIEVIFDINADGIVSVSAKDLETGIKQSITVTASSGLTDEEIHKMAEESEYYMVDRRASEEFEAARQEAERLIRELDRMYVKVEQMVMGSEFGNEALLKARDLINSAKTAIEQKNLSKVTDSIETLKRTQRMFKGVLAK
jgi:molecular chaperone DnaK